MAKIIVEFVLLPYPDFEITGRVLSTEHLYIEIETINRVLGVLHETDLRLQDSPYVDMWRGHDVQLCELGMALSWELRRRGFQPTYDAEFTQHMEWATSGNFSMSKPSWVGNLDLHESHQAMLLRMDYSHYRDLFPNVSVGTKLVWPVGG